jgi:NAD-dependent dihydropyrimidine dehydrogenase PreA subunit
MFRSQLTDCPLGAFQVEVVKCSGSGDCSSVCLVKVFETDKKGKCVVANQELCFGCMACVAQCLDHGIVISETEATGCLSVEELLK